VKIFTPTRLLVSGVLLLAVFLVLLIYPSGDYIFLPDKAHPVAPLVVVQGGHDPAAGGVYFVDVVVRKATLLERLFPGIHNGADLYPASAVDPPGVSQKQRQDLDQQDMKQSQQVAAAVALRALGKHVVLRPVGVRVVEVGAGSPAFGKLEPDDVIVAVDGTPVHTLDNLKVRMATHRIGDVVSFTIRRGKRTLVEKMGTVAAREKGQKPRPIVGILPAQAFDIQLPIKVSIDARGVGGPSAGVAFALDVMEELGHDVLHGHSIAVTGEINLDGSIGAIGGIKQKTIGARAAHVDAFVVPAGENAREARKYAHGLRIIPVETFPQALRALATLPRNG
jgi:PDZ domain-containing protein